MERRLAGRTALVTGAASGIGRAVAERLSAEGAAVGIVDRDAKGLAQTAAGIRAAGGRVAHEVADVTDEARLAEAFDKLTGELGQLSILVGIAGIELMDRGDAPVHQLELAVWQQTVAVNMTGMFLTCKHGIRAMIDGGHGGSVIIAGSPCGLYGFCTGEHAYSASKAGAMGLVRPMASDYAAQGIRVNCVVPGFVATPLTAAITGNPDAMAAACAPIPMRRPARPEEIAGLFAWLASDDASYVTGAFFTADGGHTAV